MKKFLPLLLLAFPTASFADVTHSIQSVASVSTLGASATSERIAAAIKQGNPNIIRAEKGRPIFFKNYNDAVVNLPNQAISKTPLNFILNKEFLLKKINNLDERIVDEKFINFNFIENDNEINIFFDTKTHNLIGWQTLDIYQNLSITYLNSIIKNQKIKKSIFELPGRN